MFFLAICKISARASNEGKNRRLAGYGGFFPCFLQRPPFNIGTEKFDIFQNVF